MLIFGLRATFGNLGTGTVGARCRCSLHCLSMAFIPLCCTCNLPCWLGRIEKIVAKSNKPVTHLCPHHYLFHRILISSEDSFSNVNCFTFRSLKILNSDRLCINSKKTPKLQTVRNPTQNVSPCY